MRKQKRQQKRLSSTTPGDLCSSTVSLSAKNSLITPFRDGSPLEMHDYTITRLDIGHHIHVVDNFLVPWECHTWIEFGNSKGFQLSLQQESPDYAYRNNGRMQLMSSVIARRIFDRLRPLLPLIDGANPIGCSENLRLYKYEAGQRFGKHIDESHVCEVDGKRGETKFTLLIYLNGAEDSSLSGGHTVFYTSHTGPLLTSIAPSAGRLLLHGHGRRCLTHEGAEVTGGEKYVLRTDVVYSA